MEHIKRTPPKCKKCRNIKEDDPKRILFTYFDEQDESKIVAIRCPSLKCGNGWLIEHALNHIAFENEKDITEEIIMMLNCKKEDIYIGHPDEACSPSPNEIMTALFGPPLVLLKK